MVHGQRIPLASCKNARSLGQAEIPPPRGLDFLDQHKTIPPQHSSSYDTPSVQFIPCVPVPLPCRACLRGQYQWQWYAKVQSVDMVGTAEGGLLKWALLNVQSELKPSTSLRPCPTSRLAAALPRSKNAPPPLPPSVKVRLPNRGSQSVPRFPSWIHLKSNQGRGRGM